MASKNTQYYIQYWQLQLGGFDHSESLFVFLQVEAAGLRRAGTGAGAGAAAE